MSSSEGPTGAGAPGAGSILPGASSALEKVRRRLGGSQVPPAPPPPPGGGGEDDEDDGMLRMSFMEHLEELRSRLLKIIAGMIVAAVVSLAFCQPLWNFVRKPGTHALQALGYKGDLVAITPMEQFNIIWFKMPIVCAIFLAAPWIVYQIWAFISPGLYRREKRWAAPFIVCSAGLFIAGGVFAYFVLFPYALAFLLGIGQGNGVVPMVSMETYFELFVNVILGVGLVFEMPVLMFFLTLLRIVSPNFLLRHSRYAILAIFIIAAIVTPTPDVFNLMLFATPMCLLFYVGVFAGYLLVLHREGRRFPWRVTMLVVLVVLALMVGVVYIAITKYGFHVVPKWPFLLR